ncbi:hypothetical protein DF159_20880 [Burkholderia ubonensis]|uniref:hypothetical protein n=1 Tax=Burkholderia ubonensis TaxID=101571 RepID=UPI000F55A406|nr:hypothetical protein [Burkholderia ubonensis]RQP58001.1 hypothetical protein DF159_20880 [Burkholderia ubonensis]
MKPNFELWTIYERPRDYPHSFIARRWTIEGGAAVPCEVAVVAPTLEDVRELLPPGLVRMERNDQDEPQIVETWF